MLDDLGSQVGAMALLLTAYLFLWQHSERSRKIFDDAVSDDNFLGVTGRDAHVVWGVFRGELPLLLLIFFAPVLVSIVFLPPALAIVASIRFGHPYSPLRAAFVLIEAAWLVNTVLQFRRGRLLIGLARDYGKEARLRWELDREWARGRAREEAQREAADKPAAEKTRTDEGDTPRPQ